MYLVGDARIYHYDQTQARGNWNIPVTEYWKLYYAVRNRFLLLRLHETSSWRRAIGSLFGVYRTMRTAAGVVLFRPPGTLLRLRILARGLLDGLRGREGRLIDPVEWKDRMRRRGLV
jgi:hypothetical protein